MAITLLQSAVKNAGAVPSSTLAFPSNTTAGTLLMAHVWIGLGAQTMTASDNVNGSYNQDIAQQSAVHGNLSSGIFSFVNGAGGAVTVTFTGTGGGQLRCLIEEWSGIATASALDKTGSVTDFNNNTNWSGTISGATTQANELVVCHVASAGSTTFTANQIGGSAANQDSTADNLGRPSVEYLEVFSTGTFTCTWTNAAAQGGLCIATYKAAALGPILMGAMCL
jgi:hypothetical protein